MKTAREIRAEFLRYFEKQQHRIVPSSPVVPQGDPTLLFINAGMNQFKDVFLGNGSRDYRRAADTQKCIRVSGKHNDLEEVGVDGYHHTFFEMLGNWSFGDYFKKESIAWAWDLLVNVLGLDPSRLFVTVFGGDEKDGLPADVETETLWPELTGIPADRVLRFSRKDNFWEMGDTGPCGPCTEIHFDRGPAFGPLPDPSNPASGVNQGIERVIEIWNLVFIQFNRNPDGSLSPLPARHVDTGMGLERLVSVMQGRRSNYESDLFSPIFERLEKVTGVRHGGTADKRDIACRVIADHVRTLSVAFADGALPSNEGRGYVLRRILRRAARFGRQGLGQQKPFIHALVPAVVEILGEVFPEVAARQEHIALLIESEEKAFASTLDRGLALYADLARQVKGQGKDRIPGGEAFDLYATWGFPRDLVELMAREDGLVVDAEGWTAAEEAHRAASRTEGAFALDFDMREIEGLPATRSAFYREGQAGTGDGLEIETRPLKMIGEALLILEATTFYAESGGQMGDQGVVEGDGFRFRVADTQRYGDVIVHKGSLEQGTPRELPSRVRARVDGERRRAIMANHTGTHLLHWALHQVLGTHATQQGSLVAPDRLRFDLTHPRAVTAEEIEKIEDLVNGRIRQNAALRTTVEGLAEAKARGVTALFGEKYDDKVRVVDIAGFSTELCGGTHCGSTGEIGAFLIVGESAVQAGVRRIEAVTGAEALKRIQSDRRLLRGAAATLKAKPEEVPARLEALQSQVKELKRKGGDRAAADAGTLAKDLLSEATKIGDSRIIVAQLPVATKDLSAVADVLRNGHGSVAGFLLAVEDGKVALVSFASKDLAGSRVHAGKLASETAALLGGGGGGRPDFAQAGGKDPARAAEALERARRHLESRMSAN